MLALFFSPGKTIYNSLNSFTKSKEPQQTFWLIFFTDKGNRVPKVNPKKKKEGQLFKLLQTQTITVGGSWNFSRTIGVQLSLNQP